MVPHPSHPHLSPASPGSARRAHRRSVVWLPLAPSARAQGAAAPVPPQPRSLRRLPRGRPSRAGSACGGTGHRRFARRRRAVPTQRRLPPRQARQTFRPRQPTRPLQRRYRTRARRARHRRRTPAAEAVACRMYLDADRVVKAVMIGLALPRSSPGRSFVAKTLELRKARSDVRQALRVLVDAATLAQATPRAARGCGKSGRADDAVRRPGDPPVRRRGRRRIEGAHRAAARTAGNGEQPQNLARHRRARHHRLDRRLRRTVRHGVGHHEQLHRHLQRPHHQSRGGGARHRAGAAGDRDGARSPPFRRS